MNYSTRYSNLYFNEEIKNFINLLSIPKDYTDNKSKSVPV